jgi:hypothetical protein
MCVYWRTHTEYLYMCVCTGSQACECRRMLTHADVCWRMLTYADVCWRMLLAARHEDTYTAIYYSVLAAGHAYSDVCWRMLTYADACWRMLTHADVCWRMLLAAGHAQRTARAHIDEKRKGEVLSLLALLVQKYYYWYKSTNGRTRCSAYLLYW